MYLIISIILLICLATFIYAGLSGATWVPTKRNDMERFIKLAEIKPGEKFYDLGCGNGRMTVAAAKEGAQAVGLEVSLIPYILGKLNIWLKRSSAQILYYSLWKYDISDADIIYFFLMPSKMNRLRKKFEQELKNKTRVISYVWPIHGWTPTKINNKKGHPKMFLYEVTKSKI